MKGGNVFQALDQAKVARSALDLSHEHKTTFDMGQLIPISVFECIPGDIHKIGAAAVLRMQPMLLRYCTRLSCGITAFSYPIVFYSMTGKNSSLVGRMASQSYRYHYLSHRILRLR